MSFIDQDNFRKIDAINERIRWQSKYEVIEDNEV